MTDSEFTVTVKQSISVNGSSMISKVQGWFGFYDYQDTYLKDMFTVKITRNSDGRLEKVIQA